MRRIGFMVATLFLAAATVPVTARADELVAIKPGVMCVSTDALGRLTLSSGDSRTHLAAPRPDDLAVAAAGGCIDIPLGARVQVQQAFRNTSQVVYAGPGAPPGGVMTVPNTDFRPAADASVSAGLVVAQRLPAGGGMLLVLLQDARLTPALRETMRPFGGDASMAFDEHDPRYGEFTRRPLLNGELQLRSADGTIVGRTPLDRPLASISPAPLHGMPAPTFIFMVNYSVGTGGFSGPFSQLLAPVTQGLAPLQATPTGGGRSVPIALASTLHEGWHIVPARTGGPEEIEVATCGRSTNGGGPLELSTYRFRDGHWTVVTRNAGPCDDLELFPDRRLFP